MQLKCQRQDLNSGLTPKPVFFRHLMQQRSHSRLMAGSEVSVLMQGSWSLPRLCLFLPRWVKQQCEFAKQAQNPDQGPKLDLGFKEGQTIKLNIAVSTTLAWLCWPQSGDTCGHHAKPSPGPITLSWGRAGSRSSADVY